MRNPPRCTKCAKPTKMYKMWKTHQDVQNVENPPKCAKCGKPTKMCKSPGCALLTSPSEYLLQQKVSPNAPHEMWDGILLWAFHLHVFRVGLFGVFGPDKKCILMYYHLVTQCCSVFLKSLYVSLMYHGFVFMAFSNLLPCFSDRHRFL